MTVSRRLRFEILRRDGYTCRYCGAKAPDVTLHVDHVIPEVLGGSDEPSNLVTACEPCNSGKSSVPPDASIVEDVARDALRWRAAMDEALRLWRIEQQYLDSLLEEWADAWNRYTYATTRTVVVDQPEDPVTEPLQLAWREATWPVSEARYRARPVTISGTTLYVQIEPGYRTEMRPRLRTKGALTELSRVFGQRIDACEVVDGFDGAIPAAPKPVTTTVTERHPVALGSHWRESIKRFLSLGLPLEELVRFIDSAMAGPADGDTDGTWRYFCGIAWRALSTLQEDARRILDKEGNI